MPILVLVDIARPSHAALDLAGKLARAHEKEVFLVSIDAAPAPLPRLATLHELAGPLREQGVRVLIRTCEGDPMQCISRQVRDRRCSWLILGAEHPDATEILAHSPVPAVVVGDDGKLRYRRSEDASQLGTAIPALAG